MRPYGSIGPSHSVPAVLPPPHPELLHPGGYPEHSIPTALSAARWDPRGAGNEQKGKGPHEGRAPTCSRQRL